MQHLWSSKSFSFYYLFSRSEHNNSSPVNFNLLLFAAILGVHTLVTSNQTYDGTGAKEGYNSEYDKKFNSV